MTYTFSNGSTADATQVNQNFTDLVNGLSDGTKNISVSAITAAGASNLQAAVTLGASSSNDLVVNCSLASTLAVKTTFSYDLGGSTIGLRSIYLGDSGSAARTTRIIGAAVASSWTLTTPTTAGTSGYALVTDGSGVTSWMAPAAQADQETGSSTTVFVTPGRQQYHPSAAKAWCQANVTGSPISGYNISSVTDNGTGDCTFNWTTAMSSANYGAFATAMLDGAVFARVATSTFAAGTTRVLVNSTAAATDPTYFMCLIFGDQ